MGIFDKLKKKTMSKTIEKEELSREKLKILDRNQREIKHGTEKADISAELVTSKVKTVEVKIEPRDGKSSPKKARKTTKPRKKTKNQVIKEIETELKEIKKTKPKKRKKQCKK